MHLPRGLVALLIILAPGVMLAPVWPLAGLGAGEDDILYYYPSRVLFGEFVAEGHAPFINPWTGLGRPFLADPQSGVFYPTTWLFAVLRPEWAYGASLWLHYSLAMWGVYRLLRASGQGRAPALFGGLIFAFGGFMLAHRAHFTMQHAGAWTPWIFWRLMRLADAVEGRALPSGAAAAHFAPNVSNARIARSIAAAAIFLALQLFAGHVQIAALTSLGSVVFLAAYAERRRMATIVAWVASWSLAGAMFAVQLLPTLAYLSVCTRAHLTYRDFVENSWNPVSIAGLILPMLFGQRTPNFFPQPYWGPSHQVEQFAYVGVIPLLLALPTFRRAWRADRHLRAWTLLGGFSLLLALGLYGPVCPLLYWLPGASLFRVPARALVLMNLSLAVLAGLNLGLLAGPLSPTYARFRSALQSSLRRALLLALAPPIAVIALVAATAPWLPEPYRAAAWSALSLTNPAIYIGAASWIFSVFVLRSVVNRGKLHVAVWPLVILAAVDLAFASWNVDVPKDVHGVGDLFKSGERDEWLTHVRKAPGRLWVVTTRRPGELPGEYERSLEKGVANTNILAHYATLTDYGPLHPVQWMNAFAFKPWGESDRAWDLLEDDSWMPLVGVRWVLLCNPELPLPPRGTLETRTKSGLRLVRMLDPGPNAFFEAETAAVSIQSAAPYDLRLMWQQFAESGGDQRTHRLIIRQLSVPGWHASSDRGDLMIEPHGPGLISMNIPTDTHSVHLRYEPPRLRVGAPISIAALFVTAVLLILR